MPFALRRLLLHPDRELRSAADHAGHRSALATVILSGMATAALQLVGGMVEPAGQTAAPAAAVAISLLLPIMLLLFWLAAARMVDVAAKLMAAPVAAHSKFRELSARTYPLMAGCAMVTLAQSIIDRTTGNGALSSALGVLNLAILLWFIALNGVAARVAYDLQPASAAVAALFPYAAMSGMIMLLIAITSISQAVATG